MTENQQPLSEDEQAEAPVQPDSEPIVLTPEQARDELLAAEEGEDETAAPADDRVFGMPRLCFRGAALGIAAGYILTGLIGLVADQLGFVDFKMPSSTLIAIVCAGLGYLIAKQVYNKQAAEREQANPNE